MISTSSDGGAVDQYLLFEFSQDGQISMKSRKDISDTLNINLFSHDWIHDIEILKEDRLIISGRRPFISIVDFDLNIVGWSSVSVPIEGQPWNDLIFSPKFEVIDDSSLIGSSNWVIGPSRIFEDVFFKVHLKNDSIIFDSLKAVENIEGLDKTYLQDLITMDGSVFLASNPNYQISTSKGTFPCSIYLSKLSDDEVVWHKLYGGDHYYRMRSIELIDSCKILIAGSVYDYFDNGFLQGFYAIVDCNGDLLTSNVELTEIATTVYPNPTNGPLFLEGIDRGQFVIFDVLGRTMVQGEIEGGEIDLGPIGPGTYFLKILGSNRVVKFVKE